jgi:hypothetical protein
MLSSHKSALSLCMVVTENDRAWRRNVVMNMCEGFDCVKAELCTRVPIGLVLYVEKGRGH